MHGIFPTTPDFVQAQLKAVLQDFDIKAIKTGMLFSAEIIEAIVAQLKETTIPIIVDPVMIAKGGASLLGGRQQQPLKKSYCRLQLFVHRTFRKRKF